MKSRTLIFVLFCWLFGINPVLANADNYDWPRWRGPNGDGISNETDWNPEALAGGPKILWKVDIGAGHSNVAIKDNRLYTMAQDGNKNIVYCLNARNGKEIWRYTYECGYSAYGPQATPVIDGKYVYILSTNGDLLCFKAKNGEVRWKKNIVDEFRVEKLKYGYAQSPVIDGDIIILNINISGIAIDKNTGEKIWASDVHTDLFGKEGYYATPVFYDNKNKRCALLFSDSGLYSVEVETGKRVWFYELETPYVPKCVDPVVFNNKVFISISGENGRGVLLNITENEPKVLWQNANMMNLFNTCIYVDGYLYGSSGDREKDELLAFSSIDAETGDILWEKKMKMAQLLVANGKLIILEENGTLHIAEATPLSYREISSGYVLEGEKWHGMFWTPPVLYRGKIYCRDYSRFLICLDVSK